MPKVRLAPGVWATVTGLAGGGAIMIWPDLWQIGAALIVVAVGVLIWGITIDGRHWWNRNPAQADPPSNPVKEAIERIGTYPMGKPTNFRLYNAARGLPAVPEYLPDRTPVVINPQNGIAAEQAERYRELGDKLSGFRGLTLRYTRKDQEWWNQKGDVEILADKIEGLDAATARAARLIVQWASMIVDDETNHRNEDGRAARKELSAFAKPAIEALCAGKPVTPDLVRDVLPGGVEKL